MFRKVHYLVVFPLLLAVVSPAFAAGAPREDNSMLLVYLFLGFCALIVICQLIPAILLFVGMLKGLFGRKDKTTPVPVKIK